MKKYVSKESIAYQKKIAIEMWKFMKKWYVENPASYVHPMYLKSKFCKEYFDKTGQHIDWEANCMLCNIFYDDGCKGCPLYKEDDMFCEDYFKLCDAEFPSIFRPSICDRIIKAIKSYKG